MANFKIREATRKDSKLIYDFIMALAKYEKMADLVVTNPEMLEESIFDEDYAKVIIGEEDGVPVGFALYFFNFSTFEGRPGLYLEDLFIKEEYRNKGYGKAMLQKLAGIAVQNNCKRFEWWCLDWNKPSIDFYKSLGAVGMEDWTTYRMDGEVLKNFGQEKD